MSIQDPLTPEERRVEERLRQLPAPDHGINRDALMFRAGQTAGRRAMRRQLAASGGAAALLIGLALWLAGAPVLSPPSAPTRTERNSVPSNGQFETGEPRETDALPAAPPVEIAADSQMKETAVSALGRSSSETGGQWTPDYLHLRAEILTYGTEVLRTPSSPARAAPEAPSMADWRLLTAARSPGA